MRFAPPARRHAIVVAVALCLAAPVSTLGQALEKVAAPLTVEVAPASDKSGIDLPTEGGESMRLYVLPNSTVRIFGNSAPLSASEKHVRIEVAKPDKSVAKLTGPLDMGGAYSVNFTDTAALGDYAVTALTNDGTVKASARFTVASAEELGNMIEDVIDALEEAAEEAAKAAKEAETAMANKGAFEGDARVKKDLAALSSAIKEMPARLHQLKAAGKAVTDIGRQYPGGRRHLDPILQELANGIPQAKRAADGIRRSTAQLSRNTNLCDDIDAVAETLGAVSLSFDLAGRLFNKVVQLATDKYLPDKIYNDAVPVAKRDAAEKFSLGESLKAVASMFTRAVDAGRGGRATGAAEGLLEFVKKPQNLALDTAQFLTGFAFDKLCERIQGPVTGTFKVDATINNSKFWGYTTAINGRLMLRYAKRQVKPDVAVEVTGEIEGNGDINAYEDLMAFNPFNKRFVVWRQLFQPPGMGAGGQSLTDPLGKIARYATPAYFRVPVRGKLLGDQLTITIADAAWVDFSDRIKARAFYLMIAPPVLPYLLGSNITIEKAQFVLSRGLRTTAEIPLSTITQGKTIFKVGDKTFTRKEVVSNGEVTVTWNLRVKACNPECP